MFSKVKPLDVTFDIGIPKHDQEGRTITAEFEKFILVTCYVPNAGQKLDRLDYRTKEWDLDFKNYLKSLEVKKKKCVILCGDLNVAHHEIDISNPKGNMKSAGFTKEERQGFTDLLSAGFKDSFRELHPKEVKYTYWNTRSNARAQNKGWRLDYFVVTGELMSAIAESDTVPNVMGSDHCPIKLTLTLGKISPIGAVSAISIASPASTPATAPVVPIAATAPSKTDIEETKTSSKKPHKASAKEIKEAVPNCPVEEEKKVAAVVASSADQQPDTQVVALPAVALPAENKPAIEEKAKENNVQQAAPNNENPVPAPAEPEKVSPAPEAASK